MDIGVHGEGSANLLEQSASTFTVGNKYTVEWARYNLDLNELAKLRWVEKMTVTDIALHLGWGRSAIARKLVHLSKNPDLVTDGTSRGRIKSRKHRFMGKSSDSEGRTSK